ncbi:MAG: hypothetical protein IJV26_04070 [Lachnospiraceae bacterium]|nr:hypothetical protein [Lachnospiraceae bacterium]MBQ9643195.1 hypothetical protein [Lachnospiraceae bacterium]
MEVKGSSRKRKVQFTNRKQSLKALISLSFGLICSVSCALMLYLTYQRGGEAELRYGAVVFVCLFFSLTGLILAILSRREPDRWYLISYIGMALNAMVVALCAVIIYLGVL